MRIIGGAFRGRRLASVGKGDVAAHLRPTADRVRESLFNVLASGYDDPCQNARVLDLFAGTGALGLEALSRGATTVVFVESGRTSQQILRENISLCQAQEAARILARDVRKLGQNPDVPYDLIFLDPPYAKKLGEQAISAALTDGWIAENSLIVWEESSEIAIPAGFTLADERQYGDTVIRILKAA